MHLDKYFVNEYEFKAPEGWWLGRLDERAWGNSQNMFLYFTNIVTDEKFRLSVFSRSGYSAYNSDISFREEPLGKSYKIKTGRSKKGFPTFLDVKNISVMGLCFSVVALENKKRI